MDASLAGRLLVASPLIGDRHFERTVVLLLAHGDAGALGVVLNRPTVTPVVELLDAWGHLAADPGVIFRGGPVSVDSVVGLGPTGAVDLHLDPSEMVDAPGSVRLFAGSAGWSVGQLEDEIDERAWWVVDAEPGDALTEDPAGLWSTVLRRQRGKTAWFANHPDDLRWG